MRIRHADAFNHDLWSENYDVEVRDETNPIRAGYTELLGWTLEQARIDAARQRIAGAWSDDHRGKVLISVEEEFPWFLDQAREHLASAGFIEFEVMRFSTLSSGVAAEKPA